MSKNHISLMYIFPAIALVSALMLGGCSIDINLNTGAAEAAQDPAKQTGESSENDTKVAILFTNDVHCGVTDEIGYAGLAAYKKDMEDEGYEVLLVDDGDEIQGGTIGTLTKGEAIIDIMNDVGYDIAIPGNHDFDYGMKRYMELTEKMDFPVICCNLMDLQNDKTVFDPYIIKTVGGKKFAFVGVTTPTTITSSTPAYFQNEKGEFIYGFCQGNGGKNLYKAVQSAVDAANAENPDYTILIAHLGIEESDSPYMSTDVIANTTGIDAVLDGHSHSEVDMDKVKNLNGEDVVLSQAGYKLEYIGKLTIDPDGKLVTELIDDDDYEKKDPEILRKIEEEEASYEEMISRVIGKTGFALMSTQEDGETWRVRNSETNMADLVADAYRYSTGADIAIVNGGGVRANIKAGDITYEDLINVNPFSNAICMRSVTGQEIADALEYSVSFAPDDFGGFLQVSGMTFDVDLSVKPQVKLDEDGMFDGFVSDDRRVSNICIDGKPIDPKKEYSVASIEYILFNQGNGYAMFTGDRIDLGRYLEDIDSLIEYMKSLNGEVPKDYADVGGQGRIRITQ